MCPFVLLYVHVLTFVLFVTGYDYNQDCFKYRGMLALKAFRELHSRTSRTFY